MKDGSHERQVLDLSHDGLTLEASFTDLMFILDHPDAPAMSIYILYKHSQL